MSLFNGGEGRVCAELPMAVWRAEDEGGRGSDPSRARADHG